MDFFGESYDESESAAMVASLLDVSVPVALSALRHAGGDRDGAIQAYFTNPSAFSEHLESQTPQSAPSKRPAPAHIDAREAPQKAQRDAPLVPSIRHRRDQAVRPRVDTSGTWAEAMREAEGQEICLACLEYNCGTLGFCSACLQGVSALLPVQLLRSKEDVISTFSRQEVLDATGKTKVAAEARVRQDTDQLLGTLRDAVEPLGMPPAIFRHLIRSLRSAATTGPSQLAALLSQLGHPFLTAAQAAEVIRLLVSQGDVEYKIFHVLASRVVDQWNLKNDPHSIGHCYYGYHESDALHRLIYPTQSQTLGAALCEMLQRSTRMCGESFWSESETAFLMEQVRQNNVEAAFHEHKGYQNYTF